MLSKPSPILSKTKGELLNDRKNYQSYRSAIRKHAENIYKASGKPYYCAKCGKIIPEHRKMYHGVPYQYSVYLDKEKIAFLEKRFENWIDKAGKMLTNFEELGSPLLN